MTCRDIPKGGVATYDTLQSMYVGLGIRRLPTGVHMNVDGNLPSGGLNLKAITPEALECFNGLMGIEGGSKYGKSALHGNIQEIRQLIDYLRGDGNTGDADVITGEEIDKYVEAYGADIKDFDAQGYRDLTVSNLSAYLAIVQYVGGGDAAKAPETPPADSISAATRTYGSVQQMYTGLMGSQEGKGDASTRSSVAEEVPSEGIKLGVLTEANVNRFKEAVGLTSDKPTTPLAQNAKDILELVDYFKGDGNFKDEDADVITGNEIDAYVRAYVANEQQNGNKNITFDSYKPVVVGNLRALVESVTYISNPPDLKPPQGDITPPPAGSGSATPPPATSSSALPSATSVTPVDSATPAPSNSTKTNTSTPTNPSEGTSWGSLLIGAAAAIVGAGTLYGLVRLVRYGIDRIRGGASETGAKPEPAKSEKAPKAEKTEPKPEKTEPKKKETPKAPEEADFLDDIDQALDDAKKDQTPPPADVILEGPGAKPVNGLDGRIVVLQIALQHTEFLSLGAKKSLEKTGKLPDDPKDWFDSRYETDIEKIGEAIEQKYNDMIATTEGRAELADLWKDQRAEMNYVVSKGAPEALVVEVSSKYITEQAANKSSPFAKNGLGARMIEDVEKNKDNVDFRKDGLREMMKHVGR
ncbi:MAG TPA: hypothetical protein VFX30_02620 [bacterium]|nr:hypothetical protein [bacterium]